MTGGVGAEIAAHVHRLAIAFLQVVQPSLAGLPDLDQRIRNRRAMDVGDLTMHDELLLRRLLHDLRPQRQFRRAFAVEWAEQAALRTKLLRLAIVQRVDHGADAKHIGQQDELLPDWGARLTDRGQDLEALDRSEEHTSELQS